ncbi:MAG TPA: ABC-2 family transporter protein, partial [Candidatus Methylacidiphilales bacterium]
VREMMFKTNFILWIIVDLAWFGLHLCFIQFLYLQVDSIAGWGKWEMVLLISTNQLVQQIFQTFLMINLTKLPELIRNGKLDFFLAQPAPVQFLVSTRNFEPGSVVSTMVGGIVCLIACLHLSTPLSLGGLLLFPTLVIFGVLIHYALLLMLMSLAFWMTRAQGFINAYYNVFQIARLPREAFKGVARIVFTWGVPLLLIANVPVRTLLYGLQGRDLAGMGAATAILLALSTLVFQMGLRRYGSASS